MVVRAAGLINMMQSAPHQDTDCTGSVPAAVYPVSEKGIYQSLFELNKSTGAGFHIDMTRIPISQTTVEFCEHLELNPYNMLSWRSRIMVFESYSEARTFASGNNLIFHEDKVPPSDSSSRSMTLIGMTDSSPDMLLLAYDGTAALLNRPRPDEILRVLLYNSA